VRSDFLLTPLQERINDDNAELLEHIIKEFSCEKDPDVEWFIKNNALNYERKGLSRTYLYIADVTGFPVIAAYFTLAITATSFEGISKSRKAKVLGFKPGRDTKDHFGGILIGQLARTDGFDQSDISGQEMLEDAEVLIEKGRYYLGGKIVYLDCKEPLIKFYEQNGYTLVTQTPHQDGYYKMFKSLPEM
jgi:hypothetical protein